MIYLHYTTYYIIKEKHRNNLNLKNKVKKSFKNFVSSKKTRTFASQLRERPKEIF